MRRSKSLSRIPMRQSRVSIRTPQSNAQSRARSENRNSNIPQYQPRSTSNLRGSTSNLRESTTPLGKRNLLFTPGSASTSKDHRPITNKDWQQVEFMKVKNFLYEMDHDLMALKPLSINVFVHTLDLLLKMIDDRINITMENFKEDVPMHLKIFHYPAPVKLSLMKTVNVPSNFHHILAIWSWLINQITLLQNPTPALHPLGVDIDKLAMYDIVHNYLQCRFDLWNNNEDENIADQMYEKEMVQYLNINVEAKEQMEAEHIGLEVQMASLKAKKEEIVFKNQKLHKKIKAIEKKNNEYLDSKDREKLLQQQSDTVDRLEKVKEWIRVKQASCQVLKEKLAQQTCSFKRKTELIQKIEELKHTTQLKEKRLEERRELVSMYDYKLAERNREIESTVYCINNKVTTLSLTRPELKCLKTRDTGFARRDMLQEVNSMEEKRKTYFEMYKRELEELRTKLNIKIDSQKEEVLAIKKLDSRIAELQYSHAQLEDRIQNEKIKGDEEIKALQRKHQKLAASLSDVMAERISLKDREDQLKMNLEREQMLKQQLQQMMDAGSNFFVDIANKIHAKIFKYMESEKKLATEIDDAYASGCEVYENIAKALQLDISKNDDEDRSK